MKTNKRINSWLTVLAVLVPGHDPLTSLHAQGTAFTYQGRLNDGGNPATGIYDLSFALYDAASAGTQEGTFLTNSATPVVNGQFIVTLDFGNQFPGADRWLEVAVRTNGGAAFTTLTPRQPLTPVPYAIAARDYLGVMTNAYTFNANQLEAPGDALQIKPNALLTNLNMRGMSISWGTNIVRTNSTTIFSNMHAFTFYPQDTNKYSGGSFIDFHRPINVTPQYIRWFDDSTTERALDGTIGYMGIGTDVQVPEETYWCIYDSTVGIDVFNVGNHTTNRSHVGINEVPTAKYTMRIKDILGTRGEQSIAEMCGSNVQYTIEMQSRSNGIVLAQWCQKNDAITIYRPSPLNASCLNFRTQAGTYDWRIGGATNDTTDLVVHNAGNVVSGPHQPGREILRFHSSNPAHISSDYILETGTSLWCRSRSISEANLAWDNLVPGHSGGTAGWVGIKFTVGPDDMAIYKLGRYTEYGFTNRSHQILLMTDSGGVMITNVALNLPKSASKKAAWIWADCYTVIPSGTVVRILTDAYPDTDYYSFAQNWPLYTGSDTNLVDGTIYGIWTNGVLNPNVQIGGAGCQNYNGGPVSYLRY